MAFNPALLTRQAVFDAVEEIEDKNIRLNASTGYDVVINNRRYPPKEIVRYAYRIATGEEIGIIYGGEQVNKLLRNLEFNVVPKIKFWKLGCNWESGNPSFFNFIKEQSIVLTVDKFPFGIGDMVLITEGFTVYAIAKVTGPLKPITTQPEWKTICDSLEVPFDSWLKYATVEWSDLTDNQIFKYKLQQGIRQVHQQEAIYKVLDAWENREAKLGKIQFYVKDYQKRSDDHWQYPCMVLVPNNWDDYGFRTCFDLYYYKDAYSRDPLAEVKILQKHHTTTELPPDFTQLPPEFCSLGQTLAYYKKLRSDFPYEFMQIGQSMNDCVLYPEIRVEFESVNGFQDSLLRSSEAQKALSESNDLLNLGEPQITKPFIFKFDYTVPGAAIPHQVDFSFFNDLDLPNRFFCLIGKNGTGKTRVLVQLAKKLSNTKEEGVFIPDRPLFSKIIAVSFSFFDKFEMPKTEDISYELISFKDKNGLLSEEEISNKLWQSYKLILKSRIRKNIWLNCIKEALELEFLKFNTQELETLDTKQDFVNKLDDIFSSGQKITFHFFTRLLSCIEKNSVIIFDEPETHLHPNVAARLIKTLKYALDNFNSFCIMATHSPVIVQEIPSRFIRIIERRSDIPFVFSPAIECFGENLANINTAIFHVDQEKELYKITLEELAKTRNVQNIDELFNNQLSLNARLYLQTVIQNNNDQLPL